MEFIFVSVEFDRFYNNFHYSVFGLSIVSSLYLLMLIERNEFILQCFLREVFTIYAFKYVAFTL